MRKLMILATVLVAVMAAGWAVAGSGEAEYDGHCPVAYVAMNEAIKGDPSISADFAGRHYVFANADAKKMFEKEPTKYGVAYDGYCATAVSMGKKLDSDPTMFTVKDGTTYLFSSADAKKMFEKDADKIVAMADKQWHEINAAYDGYCPVAYVAMNKAIKGSPDITAHQNHNLILLANKDAEKMFAAHPEKYAVAYGGHCATAMSMGMTYPSDPTVFAVVDGTTYLFSSEKAKKMFEAKTANVVKMADEQWATLN